MGKILEKIPTVALGIAGYTEIQNLKERMDDLEFKIKLFMVIFSIFWVSLWSITILGISLKIS